MGKGFVLNSDRVVYIQRLSEFQATWVECIWRLLPMLLTVKVNIWCDNSAKNWKRLSYLCLTSLSYTMDLVIVDLRFPSFLNFFLALPSPDPCEHVSIATWSDLFLYKTSVLITYFVPLTTALPSWISEYSESPCGKHRIQPCVGSTPLASIVPTLSELGTKNVVAPPVKSEFK